MSKLRIVPAKRVVNALASNWSMGPMPLTPSRTLFQPSATVLPTGEIKPEARDDDAPLRHGAYPSSRAMSSNEMPNG